MSLFRSVRFAVRSLRRRPGFVGVSVVTLAVGLGATAMMSSVIWGTLLAPLPYGDVDRLVWLTDAHEDFGGGGANISVPNYVDIAAASTLMDRSAVYKIRSGNLAQDNQPERIRVLHVSSDFLNVLGVRPQLGRDFAPSDDLADGEPVALLTHPMWESRFGSDPNVLGQAIRLGGRSVQVVGVLPPSFHFPGESQILLSLQHVGAPLFRGNRGHYAIAKMIDGVEIQALRDELRSIWDGLEAQYPDANDQWVAWADPLEEFVRGDTRGALALLGGAVLLLLVMTCTNVANLVLVRSEGRRQEVAVRASLGATKGHLFPQYLAEGLGIALLSGVVGLGLAAGGLDVLLASFGDSLSRSDAVTLGPASIGITLGLVAVIGLALGLTPLRLESKDNLGSGLRTGRHGAGKRGRRLRQVLVVAEVALAVILVSGAGLLIRSVEEIQKIDLGVTGMDQALTFRMSLPLDRYHTAASIDGFFDGVYREASTLPGVESVGFVNRLPLLGGDNTTVQPLGVPDVEVNFTSIRMVNPEYFSAIGANLVQGRTFVDPPPGTPASTVVINQALAEALFPGRSPIGERMADPFTRPGDEGFLADGLEVVGVISDIAGGSPDRPAPPAFYVSMSGMWVGIDDMEFQAGEQLLMSAVVRATGDPYSLGPMLRRAVADVDSELPIYELRTLGDLAVQRLGSRRLAVSLLGVFAGIGLILGATGVYGVMAYSVAQRSRELGVRLALGAARGAVLGMVLRDGIRLAAPGLLIGVLGSLAMGSALERLLFEVSPRDPVTLVAVVVILAGASILAAFVPALKATRVDPLIAMQGE